MSKKVNETESTMQQSNSVKNTIANAYFRFILYDTPLLNSIIIQIKNMFDNTNYNTIALSKGAFLIDTNNDLIDISGKKAALLIVLFKDISIFEYYKLIYMVKKRSDWIFDTGNDSIMVSIDTSCSNEELEISSLYAYYIDLNRIEYLIRRYSEYSLLLNNYKNIYMLLSKAKTKISVYAINSNKIIEDSDDIITSTEVELNNIFNRHNYSIGYQSVVPKNTNIVSFYPNELDNSLGDILVYEFEYDGADVLYEECISELISFAKDNIDVIGIILTNESNIHSLVYKSNPEFQFNVNPLVNRI